MNFNFIRALASLKFSSFKPSKNNYFIVKPKFCLNPVYIRIMANSVHATPFSNSGSKTEKKKEIEKSQELFISENDSMEYRLIQLKNGLKAILISDVKNLIDLNSLEDTSCESDEESEASSYEEVESDLQSEDDDLDSKTLVKEAEEKMAACALCVGVGSFSDPPDIPGLAHFLEHMVFMGSNKYPKENGFDEFIMKYGGSDNGATECETTTFYLECNEKYLREGMDRFAQFFISPLMKREAMTREREIIHSEFEMSLPSDDSRREQLLGSLAPAGHPAAKFLWGNLTTLRTNIDDDVLYEKVHEFRKRHYSAHRMTVAVQGRLPLDVLEQYVKNCFSDIPTNDLPPDDFSEFKNSYGTPSTFNKILWVKPVKNICQLYLTWVLPSYLKEYKSKPLDYVAWFIEHEGEGSLLSYLRKKVWALECEAENEESGFEHNTIYSLFTISLKLTEDGYNHVNEVIGLVFSHIAMLRQNCPSVEIFNELDYICNTNFRYKTEIPADSYVELLAESMHIYEPQHYIAGGEIYFQYKPQLITEILNLLTPGRVNVMVYSEENPDSFYDQVEPWFQTKYKIEDIPHEWMKLWLANDSQENFHIPRPNPYLTTDFSLLEIPEHNPPYPVKIQDDNLLEIWYRQDVKFKQPLAYYYFYILSPDFRKDLLNMGLLDLLSSYLETKLSEKIFPANEAGLYCSYFPAELGLFLLISGYSQKLPLLFDEVLKSIRKCCSEINDESNLGIFNAIKKGKSRTYYNKFLKPKKLVKMARLTLLLDNHWTTVEYLEIMDQITLSKLHEFAENFFQNVRILGLFQGNVSQEKCKELCQKFRTVLHCSPLVEEKPEVRVTKLNPGELFLRLKSFNESDSNSVVVNYYQAGQGSLRTSCMIDLLMMVMDEPLFDNLRTKQQIGYDVHCLLRDTFGILGFSVTVFFQAHKFSPDEVDDRIEAFLKSFVTTLKKMPKKEWEETKASLCLLKSSADLQLQDEVKRNFAEICSNNYLFDRFQKEVEIIPDISHKELCNWFVEHIASGKHFKKLSVQVVGDKSKNGSESFDNSSSVDGRTFHLIPIVGENDKKNLFITDIEAYKSSREFYPAKKKS